MATRQIPWWGWLAGQTKASSRGSYRSVLTETDTDSGLDLADLVIDANAASCERMEQKKLHRSESLSHNGNTNGLTPNQTQRLRALPAQLRECVRTVNAGLPDDVSPQARGLVFRGVCGRRRQEGAGPAVEYSSPAGGWLQ